MIFVLSSDEEDSGSGRRAKHAQNQNNKPKSKVPNGSEADDTDGASRYCFFR
jgi:protein phosphatase 4 regulatory subunit 3